jgi:hypothetical protein
MSWKMITPIQGEITAITPPSHPGMGHHVKKGGVKEFPSLNDNRIPIGRH